MKAWEALNLLQGINPNQEVTIIIGNMVVPVPNFQPNPPHWTPQYPTWFTAPTYPKYPNEITCATHRSQFGDH